MKRLLFALLSSLALMATQPFNQKPLPHENSPRITVYINKDDQGNYFVQKIDVPVEKDEKIASMSFRVVLVK